MSNSDLSNEPTGLEIAVVGLAGRFPGARNVDEFWRNLRNGVESITFFSDEDLLASGVEPSRLRDPNYVKASGFIEDDCLFDASFFGITPREADMMDPQHRLVLECAWTALESAGCCAENYDGSIGVYAGVQMSSYFENNLLANRDFLAQADGLELRIGNDKDFFTTRVSYKLNLTGPSVVVQSACSTSLVAVHMACQGLLAGECDMALAGGASVRMPSKSGYQYAEGGILSPDGHCRTFDAKAKGTVPGQGVCLVALKRLEDALSDGDHIHAVIKGSATNNDGSSRVGYTAPSVDGQADVITRALSMSGVNPETIGYVEAHGTATPMGDPIEIAALTQAYGAFTDKKGYCAIGSLKSNMGHMDCAAGVAGLMKAVLTLEHGEIPASLHFQAPNPEIDFAASPFYVNDKLAKWEAGQTPRRAAVSSFGMGGSNAHVILEQAPPAKAAGKARDLSLIALSARTPSVLDRATANLAEFCKSRPALPVEDAARTLIEGRKAFPHRRFVVCRNAEDLASALDPIDHRRVVSGLAETKGAFVAYMFSGQGSQYPNMGLGLYRNEPVFQAAVDDCIQRLKPHMDVDLFDTLYPGEDAIDSAGRQLDQTSITQPALFIVEYAMARLWMSWGVGPRALIGHSIGEYVAACLAGVFSLDDALALVAERGRLMQEMPAGAMAAVSLPPEEIEPLLNGNLSLAAINGPSLCTVSGPHDAIEELRRQLKAKGKEARPLHTSHAFHSSMMDPILEPFARRVGQIKLNPPQIPFLSNLTGGWIKNDEATDPQYWARHLRQGVRFADGIKELLKDPSCVLLEVGPGRTLATLAKSQVDQSAGRAVLSSIRHPRDKQDDMEFLLAALGRLWMSGIEVDWPAFYGLERRRIPLPTYPFQGDLFLVEPQKGAREDSPPQASQEKKPDIGDWFYAPTWKRSFAPAPAASDSDDGAQAPWLMFIDRRGVGDSIARRLRDLGRRVTTVAAADGFAKTAADQYSINPGKPEDYDALLAALQERDRFPSEIVHLWETTSDAEEDSSDASFERSQDLGYYSLLNLAQAVGRMKSAPSLRIRVVTNHLYEVTGGEILCPRKASLFGPCQTIPLEYSGITCRLVDICLHEPGSERERRLFDRLLGELLSGSADTMVAYRGNHRWVRGIEPVRLPKPAGEAPRIRKEGVYLITGGLGGIGLVLAEHLARTSRARLILLGRSAFPERENWDEWLSVHGLRDMTSQKIRKVQELEELGSEVLALSCDVADRERLREAIARGQERFGPVNGVIHSAGAPDGAVIQRRTRETSEAVLAPKVRGTLLLSEILSGENLDFFVLCSSLASDMAPAGQVAYCAANAFQDAFAHSQSAAGENCFTVSINWDTWQEVGMAVKAVEILRDGMRPAEARGKAVAHPLFDHVLADGADGKATYVTKFSAEKHWPLGDHRVGGKAVLVGTAYLEMARAAFEDHAGPAPVEIPEAYLLSPLSIEPDEEKEVQTVLEKRGKGYGFSIRSRADSSGAEWVEHAMGEIAACEAKAPKKRQVAEIQRDYEARPGVAKAVRSEGAPGQAGLVEAGARWKVFQHGWFVPESGLALFEAPEEFAADFDEYKLHPAMLDAATAFLLRNFQDSGAFLPFSFKGIRIYGSLPRKVYSLSRLDDNVSADKGTLKFNISIMDEDGAELVSVDQYIVRKVESDRIKGGMARSVAAVPASGEFEQSLLKHGLLSAEGVEAFNRILSGSMPQVLVSTMAFGPRLKAARALGGQSIQKALDKPAGYKPAHARPELKTSYSEPRNDTERTVSGIWQELLGISQVGIYDNFFELGGHSLLATQIISRLREAFAIEMPMGILFEEPSVAGLSEYIEATFLAAQEPQRSADTAGEDREEFEI